MTAAVYASPSFAVLAVLVCMIIVLGFILRAFRMPKKYYANQQQWELLRKKALAAREEVNEARTLHLQENDSADTGTDTGADTGAEAAGDTDQGTSRQTG
jgi:hypothetical protein